MTSRQLTALWLGLSLVSCDKPGSPEARDGTDAAAETSPRGKHSLREPAADPGAESREMFAAAERMESPAEREKAFAEIAWNTIETDPETAHRAFGRIAADSVEKIRLIRHYAMRLAERNPEEALEWAASLGSEAERSAAATQIALQIAESDPLRAAHLISESGVAGRDYDVAVVQVIQRWAASSPPDAAAWVSAFPAGEARSAGFRHVAERWLPADASAAFAWLGGLKDAQVRAEAARAMEGVILRQPEETRKAWLESADPGIRAELERQRDQALLDVGGDVPPPQE